MSNANNVLLDLFVRVDDLRKLAKSAMITVQKSILFLFSVYKIILLLGGIYLWREIFF